MHQPVLLFRNPFFPTFSAEIGMRIRSRNDGNEKLNGRRKIGECFYRHTQSYYLMSYYLVRPLSTHPVNLSCH